MKIAHITDIHIGIRDEKPNAIDVRRNFLNVLESISLNNCKYIIITGDLCYRDPDIGIYKWIKDQLDETLIRYDILSGNHDDNKLLAKVFNYSLDDKNNLYYTNTVNNWTLICLDTSTSNISNNQLGLLSSFKNNKETIIFTHYPFVPGHVKHMDRKYPFNATDKIMDIIKAFTSKINVFCGHYHVEKTIIESNMNIFITPSTFFQINQESEEFSIDHKIPGWRLIELTENTIYTTVKYIKDNTKS